MAYSSKHYFHNENLKKILNDIISRINNNGGMTMIGLPGLTYGSSDNKKVKNSDFHVFRNGVITKIDTAETALVAGVHSVADEYLASFLIYLDEENDIKILKGEEVHKDAEDSTPVCPETPEGGFKIGEMAIDASSGAFVAGTSALTSAVFADQLDAPKEIGAYSSKHWLHQENLKTVLNAIEETLSDGLKFLSNPELKASSNNKAISHGALVYVKKNGKISTVSAGDVGFTATTHNIDNSAGGSIAEASFLVYLDGSTVKLLMSEIAAADKSVVPALPAGKIKVGYAILKIKANQIFVATDTAFTNSTIVESITFKDAVSYEDDDFDMELSPEHYLFHSNFKDLLDDLIEKLNHNNSNTLLSVPELGIGSNDTRVKHGKLSALRDGESVKVAAESTGIALTSSHNLAAGFGAAYNIYLNAANAVTILKGTSVSGGIGAVCPVTPSGGMKIGEMEIVNESSSTFVGGTTALDATDITTTFVDKVDVFDLL